ncbi:MAG: zinc ribbon domain-containing protein [candidate division Zixibacteria bacterium]|nr:zinc ribbon domain-containing protein [candidate division Zixibacteria bacterium]
MPTYEYLCKKCGQLFELIQKISDPPAKACPTCGGKAQKIFSTGGGFLFKGSGFYITDYRSESYKKKAKEEAGSTTPKTSQPEPKKE